MVSMQYWNRLEAKFDRPIKSAVGVVAPEDLLVDLHKRVLELEERVIALEEGRR